MNLLVASALLLSSLSVAPQPFDAALQNVLKSTTPSVVRICFGDGDMLTGTIISPSGLILTCAHLHVPISGTVEIILSDGRKAPATVLSKLPAAGESNIGKDLSLLQITTPGSWPTAMLAKDSAVSPDDSLVAIGFPDTLMYGEDRIADPSYIRVGHMITSPYQSSPGELITSIRGTGGDSGGPLFDLSGRLIGVVHGGDTSGAHLNYTRIEVLRDNWDKLAPAGFQPPAAASPSIPSAPIESIAAAAQPFRPAVVEILSDSRWIGLGCIVADGLILTKASELGSNLTAVLANDCVGIVEIAATDPIHDLALLRLQYAPELTKGIAPIKWTSASDVPPGTPVVLATPPDFSPIVGVSCFGARPVPQIQGFIPCRFEDSPAGLRVAEILQDFRKYRLRQVPLPLRVGDILTDIEGEPVPNFAAFVKLTSDSNRIGNHPNTSGEPIRFSCRRGEQVINTTLILEFSRTPSGQLVRPCSNRYSSFPNAIATDLAIRPEHCGGPIFDSQGRAVGILIARCPFIESLVIPAAEVSDSLNTMMKTAAPKP